MILASGDKIIVGGILFKFFLVNVCFFEFFRYAMNLLSLFIESKKDKAPQIFLARYELYFLLFDRQEIPIIIINYQNRYNIK
jgi:hypothetical protein